MEKRYPRIIFRKRLKELRDDMEEMGKLTLKAYKNAIKALIDYDENLVTDVNETGEQIAKMNNDLETKTMSIIAAEQPVARDLRFIESTLKVGANLKRMAFLAVNIAEVARQIKDDQIPEKPLDDIKRMAILVEGMIGKSNDAFLNQDMDIARELHREDDKVDDLFDTALNDITQSMVDEKNAISYMVYLLFVARFLERIADRAESIGDRTIFMITCEKP